MFTKKFYILLITLFFFSQLLIAQVHVNNNGSVGIGTETISSDTKFKLTFTGLSIDTSYGMYIEDDNSVSPFNYGMYANLASVTNKGYGGGFIGSYVGVEGKTSGSVCSVNNYRYGGAFYGYDGDVCHGVLGKAEGLDRSYAFKAIAQDGSISNYGVWSKATGSISSTNIAIYGYTDNNTNCYAGYFDGNVVATGTIIDGFSDEGLKENVQTVTNALNSIKKLKTKSFTYRTDKKINLSSGKKYGFMAQELEKIFPEMVVEVAHPIFSKIEDPESENGQNNLREEEFVTYKAIHYNQLIPLLTQALQEQQEQIEDLQKDQEDMLKRIEQLEKKK